MSKIGFIHWCIQLDAEIHHTGLTIEGKLLKLKFTF